MPLSSSVILERLTDVLQDVFDENLEATRALSAADVDGWDSLRNVQVFLAIEQRFGVRFSAAEIGSIENLGQLADLIEKKST